MKRLAFFLVLLAFSGTSFRALAQGTDPAQDVQQSQDILSNLDSLLNLWYVKRSTPAKTKRAANIYNYQPDEVPVFTDSAYTSRIAKIESPLPLVYNSAVKAFIDLYAVRKRKQVERMLGLAEHYFPMMEEIFDKHNIPIEIKYLSIVESALNTRAVSRVGATGLWQFMYTTGKLYNLEASSFVDQRRDPVRATEAAAVYLKDLHGFFGDWFLAIAAYNCGPGNVNKAIRRSGGKRTFWEIYRYLPVETRGYVPAFIAATYVFHYHQEHNLYPVQIDLPQMVDTVHISKEISFDAIATVLKIEQEMLRDLNPQYKRDVVPARGKNYILRLPSSKAAAFAAMDDSIYSYYASIHSAAPIVAELGPEPPHKKTASGSSAAAGAGAQEPKARVYYTIKRGDNISLIADVFDVSVHDIRRWNRLGKSSFPIGKRLVMIVPADRKKDYLAVNSMTGQQKKNLAVSEKIAKAAEPKTAKTTQTAAKSQTPKGEAGGGKAGAETAESAKTSGKAGTAEVKPAPKKDLVPSKIFIYEVQKGDTLWSIAQRFPGITVDDIKKANNISDNRAIQVGQKIKIGKG